MSDETTTEATSKLRAALLERQIDNVDPVKWRARVEAADLLELVGLAGDLLREAEAVVDAAVGEVTRVRNLAAKVEGLRVGDYVLVDAIDRNGELAGMAVPGADGRILGQLGGVLVLGVGEDASDESVERAVASVAVAAPALAAGGFGHVLVLSTGIRALRLAHCERDLGPALASLANGSEVHHGSN